jgi:anti-sigma B factor antagonist
VTPFEARVEPQDGAVLVHVEGELDLATAPLLREVLDDVRARGALRTLVDLRPCTFIDSSGCRGLVSAGESFALEGRSFALICPTEHRNVRFVLDLLGIDAALPVVEGVPGLDGPPGGP